MCVCECVCECKDRGDSCDQQSRAEGRSKDLSFLFKSTGVFQLFYVRNGMPVSANKVGGLVKCVGSEPH